MFVVLDIFLKWISTAGLLKKIYFVFVKKYEFSHYSVGNEVIGNFDRVWFVKSSVVHNSGQLGAFEK